MIGKQSPHVSNVSNTITFTGHSHSSTLTVIVQHPSYPDSVTTEVVFIY